MICVSPYVQPGQAQLLASNGIEVAFRRLGFECEILLIANCEFLHKAQSKLQEKEYAMNNYT